MAFAIGVSLGFSIGVQTSLPKLPKRQTGLQTRR